ncbi:ABC transporter ATP-binding protein [Helcococcus ovis]|uniref:ABC transporter ATP-binding protein n=1 Tax=Helcococcus ovis TaxID=72026 RepID=A0A4V3IY45_9FIRM|nr:ABC transporter ATP-binding protein [Helcococcus ovis]TFF63892.1 ABC transporter ATP-binding protein [Helcococcus ovis]TFF64591.1 ABC transporter ATP-binding protein [Helcococcus ovis]
MNDLVIKNLNKNIKGVNILNDINLSLDAGNIYGFVGVNGSGKTMLFRAISGLINVDSGSIEIFGEKIGKDVSFPSSIGIVIDSNGFWEDLTGFENLKKLSYIKKISTEQDIINSLEKVGLSYKDNRIYKKYSLGMKQRLSIAQAIFENPRLLIFDEPTNALDEDGIQLFYKILQDFKKNGAIILIASHNKSDIEIFSDRIFRLNDGKISEVK